MNKASKGIKCCIGASLVALAIATQPLSRASEPSSRMLYHEMPAIFENRGPTAIDLQVYDVTGSLTTSTTMAAGQIQKLYVVAGTAKVYRTGRASLEADRPISSCAIPNATAIQAFRDKPTGQVHFEIADGKIALLVPKGAK